MFAAQIYLPCIVIFAFINNSYQKVLTSCELDTSYKYMSSKTNYDLIGNKINYDTFIKPCI